jgi:hypothetical protein
MFPSQLERLAAERKKELDRSARWIRTGPSALAEHRQPLQRSARQRAGWAILAMGLRIATSGNH